MPKCEQCIVRRFNSLKALNKEELLRISNCKSSIFIKKGEVIFKESETLSGVYCVRDGVCKVSKLSSNGKNQIIKLLKKGDLLGQRSLINEESTNLSAVAINDMELCFIPKKEILNDLQNNSKFSMEVMRRMAYDLRDTDNMMIDMVQKSVKQRLAMTLLYLKETFQEDTDGFIDIKLTRKDIASLIGTVTESVIRLLSEFKKKGFIDSHGKKIKVLDEKKLDNISQKFD